MILQALTEYYARRAADPASAIAPPGWEWKALPFLVEIDLQGAFVQLVDTRLPEGKRPIATRYLVPKAVVRTSGVKPNLLWDSLEYALGAGAGDETETVDATERVVHQHQQFVAAIEDRFGPSPADPGLSTLLRFVRDVPLGAVRADPLWAEASAANGFVSFRIAGETSLICQSDAVRAALVGSSVTGASEVGATGTCLVTGNHGPIARLHPPIKGVRGANTSGASIVSFNLSAFESYGREQGANAPVGEAATFAYTSALNSLLASGSRQRALVADTTVAFWGERREASALEDALSAFFSEPAGDDPHAGTGAIAALYTAHRSGGIPVDEGGRFYVLGLAPNAARLAVRFWHVGTVRQISERLVAHFDDLEIVRGPNDREHPTLFRILAATAVQGKAEAVPPLLGGEVVRAILAGGSYPAPLLEGAIRRSRAEREVRYVRAATIKACLNRLVRSSRVQMKELTVSLDPENPDPGYRLGRLFAVLERAQEWASPGLNATIRDRYYGAASTTPLAVFPRLLALKNHHVAKIDAPGRRTWIERTIGEITDGIVAIPAHLGLPAQGAFAIGYYHQRQSFFAPKTETIATPEGTN
jgi:CRISPR-associated protein Csd1